jgi:hypothetical protein
MNPQTSSAIVAQKNAKILLRQANQIYYLKNLMKKDVHYGPPYPNSKKDTLLKPGAEWLAKRFRIRPAYVTNDKMLHIEWEQPERSYVMYEVTCEMYDIANGRKLGEASGACNSLEEKYRYRGDKRVCPTCNQPSIIKSKFADRKTNDIGWWCNPKAGGCGANFHSTDPAILNQPEGRAINTNPLDLQNTILKMAQKRAFVSAVLVATGASSYFAPGDDAVSDLFMEIDMDDENVIDAEFDEIEAPDEFPIDEPRQTPPSKPAQQQAKPPQSKPEEKPAPAATTKSDTGIDIPKLIEWAFKTHVMGEGEVLKALEASVSYNVPAFDAFKGDRIHAMAAVICARFNYDPTAIEKHTTEIKVAEGAIDYRFELWQHAQKIILLNQPPVTTASTPTTGWTGDQHEEIYNYLFTHFRLDKDGVLESLEKSDWSEFGTVEKAKEAIRGMVAKSEGSIMMVATEWKKVDGYMLFNTLFQTRLYGNDLMRALEVDWALPLVDQWKSDETPKGAKGTFPRPLLVSWKPGGKGNNTYYQVTDLMVLSEDDDDWSADDPKAP